MKTRRSLLWLLVLAIVIALGLASRRYASSLPGFISSYAGDTLYAMAMFAFITLVLPRWTIRRVAIISLIACVLIEISQLYYAPWIDSIRATHLGGWILGFGFLWSDLICYAVGVAMMAALTRLVYAGSISTRQHMEKEI